MALLRRSRRARRAGSADPPGPPPPAPPGLDERLRAIAAAHTPEEALEAALRAIVEASPASAGALCLFDQRRGLLRLASEVGLSDEGCRYLRQVRRGDPGAWDMPLHGLLNRRAYLIENAARNRYVPRLVTAAASVRSIACVPLYAGPAPVGSLVLVALAPRSLAERDVRVLERGLREVARMIQAARGRPGLRPTDASPLPAAHPFAEIVVERDRLREEVAARSAERACLAADLAARHGENERLHVALEGATERQARLSADLERVQREAERALERLGSLEAALATAGREQARLVQAAEAAAAERQRQARALAEAEAARTAATEAARAAARELAGVRHATQAAAAAAAARVAAAESETARLRERVDELEAEIRAARESDREWGQERQRLAAELRAAAAREHALREELRVAAEGAAPVDDAAWREALEASAAAEAARAAALAEAEAARVACARAEAAARASEAETRRVLAEAKRTETSAQAARETLEAARSAERAATTRLAERERAQEALAGERDRLEAARRDGEARIGVLGAQLEAVAVERDRLQHVLAAAEAARDRLVGDVAAETAARARAEDALRRESDERARLGAALVEAQAALAVLERVHAQHEAEAAARGSAVARENAALPPSPASESADAASGAAAAGETPPSHVRIVTVAPSDPSDRRRVPDPSLPLLAVLDVDGTWEDQDIERHGVALLLPGDDVTARLERLDPVRIVANLCAPGVLPALEAIRAQRPELRFWGCLARPDEDAALGLGMIEPATRPLDADAIVAALGAYAVRGTRVVTAGADVDALMSLRQALARNGLSVSMAWDAKQATDLLGVVRPEVVVVDLELPRRDGHRILADLAALDLPPTVILVPGDDDAAVFASMLSDPARAPCRVPRAALLRRVLARSEAPPVDRRQKVRSIGRK